MSLGTRGVVACVALLTGTLTACASDPVAIDAPQLDADQAKACRDLVADLPDTLAGKERRDVTGDTRYGAAWGDPAIVVTCGVGEPEGFTDTATCIQVDSTGWFVPDEVLEGDESMDVTTTELNYRPRVELVVPGEYRPDGFTNSIGALAKLIARDLVKTGRCH